jgi:hypothetical protein
METIRDGGDDEERAKGEEARARIENVDLESLE